MQQRKQVDQLVAGDRFATTLTVTAEVIEIATTSEGTLLQVKAVPCGQNCQETCGCAYRMLGGKHSHELFLSTRQRVEFQGNLSDLLAESERIRSQIERLKNSEASTPPQK